MWSTCKVFTTTFASVRKDRPNIQTKPEDSSVRCKVFIQYLRNNTWIILADWLTIHWGPLGSWFEVSVLGESRMQCYREPSLFLHCHRPIRASLRTKDLSVTFVHSRKQAKQPPDMPNNTENIPSKNVCRGGC